MILKGSDVALKIKEDLTQKISELKSKLKSKNSEYKNPVLGIIRVGNNKSDLSYERGILKKFGELEIETKVFELPEDISQENFNSEFQKINNDENITGILLFRPLPKNLNDNFAREIINPSKDLDCMGYINTAKLFSGESDCFAPCTPSAVLEILDFYNIQLSGKNIVIVGRSMVLGKPLAMLLLSRNATVTICHSKTENLKEICKAADVLIVAIGKAEFITSEFVNPNSVVIDVGINVNKEGKLCGNEKPSLLGDVDFQNVSGIVKSITPVPGGVGAVTTSVLAKNLFKNTDII